MNTLKNLVQNARGNSGNTYTINSKTSITQADLDKFTQTPVKITPMTPSQHGWVCPQCGAVMSPWTAMCINCTGTWRNTPQVTFDKYTITCNSPDITK